MDELKAAVAKLQTDVHIIDKTVAVLTNKFVSLDHTIEHLASTVQTLAEALQQAHGAAKYSRSVWTVIGILIGGCSMIITYLKYKQSP